MHRLDRLARLNGGYVTRREARDLGYGDEELAKALDDGWTVLRRGVYAPQAWYDGLSETDRHLLLVRSVLTGLGPGWLATHDSAVVAHGLGSYRHGTYELDLDVAHVARIGGTTSRRTASIQYHRASVDPSLIGSVAGLPVLDETRTVVETMTTLTLDAATVLASTWLARRRLEARLAGRLEEFDEDGAKQQLRDDLAVLGRRPGTRVARDAIGIADAACESVAEVRFLVLCWEHDLPRPRTQLEVAFGAEAYAEVDFAWPDVGLVAEVDGMLKYADDPDRPDAAKGRVLAEKRRERAIRDAGWSVIRITWADLAPENRARTAAYIRRELEKAARLRARRH